MKSRIIVAIPFVLILILAVTFWSLRFNNDKKLNSANMDDSSTIGVPDVSSSELYTSEEVSFNEMTVEDYIDYLKALPAPDENTLLFYSDARYSPEGSAQTALNELLVKSGYEFRVEFRQIPSFSNDINMLVWEDMQAEGIPVDVFVVDTLKKMANSGMLADITRYLETSDGVALKETVPEAFWKTTQIDGKYYGVGNIQLPAPKGWAVNKALMQKYHLTTEDLAKPLWELEDVLARVYEGEKDVSDFVACAFIPYNFIYHVPFTQIIDAVGVFHEDETVTAVNLYESDYIRRLAETLDRLRERQYYIEYEGQENFFMELDFNGFPMFDANDVSQEGVEVVRIPYFETFQAYVEYPSVCAVSSRSDKKDWSFALLSFIYQNAEASNLLRYGIEGEDYFLEDGFVVPANESGRVRMYYSPLGNSLISMPIQGLDPLDKETAYHDMSNQLEPLPIDGFIFDQEKVSKQIQAVLAISLDYPWAIFYKSSKRVSLLDHEYGTVGEVIDAFNIKLKEAGIDDIIDEMNRQIQTYLNSP